jgi:hypothetical protein
MATHAKSPHLPAEALLDRIRREFCAQCAMRLTLPQASRLFALDQSVCRSLLEDLVSRHELIMAPDGAYQRHDLHLVPRTRSLNAPAFVRQ